MKGLWKKIEQYYRYDETQCVNEILLKAAYPAKGMLPSIQGQAKKLIEKVREKRLSASGLDAFMFQYDLSSEEGIVKESFATSENTRNGLATMRQLK